MDTLTNIPLPKIPDTITDTVINNRVSQIIINNITPARLRYIKIASVVIVIVLVANYLYKDYKYNRANPVFLKSGHFGNKPYTVNSRQMPNSLGGIELSTFCWLYIDNITYKYGSLKHIFTKGNVHIHSRSQCPSVWLDSKTNDLIVNISGKHMNDTLKVKDIPIKKWFSLSIVINGTSVDSYINGELHTTKTLSSEPKINHGNLHVCKKNGFKGAISTLGIYSHALNVHSVKKLHSYGPDRTPLYKKIINMLKRLFGQKVESALDLDMLAKKTSQENNKNNKNNKKCS